MNSRHSTCHAGRVSAEHGVIRQARPDDRDGVWPLARDFATSFTLDRSAFDVTWERLMVAPDTLVTVAEAAGGDIVGYLLASTRWTFLANGPVAWVEEVMVEPARRRSGVGVRLVGHAEQWARSAGAGYVALASRRAGPFYLALGYEDSAVFFKKTLG